MPILAIRLLGWLLLLIGVGLALADDRPAVPRLTARVTDLTATLSADQRGLLEAKLAALERDKGSQIVVLIVPTVEPEAIEQYALRVVEAWQPGRRGVDDGALLLVAKAERKLRIEVGYGLEGALNDATAKRIISETISPRFRQGDYYGGIDAGVEAMSRVIAGEVLPAPGMESGSRVKVGNDNFDTWLFIGFILVFVVGGVLRALVGRLLAAAIVGVGAAVIASLLISSLLVAAIIGLVGFVVSLVLPSGLGGSFGGISRGGGRGRSGGFSGGGGGFGGGGASGDW